MAYNQRKGTINDQLRMNGGVVKPHATKIAGETHIIPEGSADVDQPKVYQPRRRGIGPIDKKPVTYTIYDLITSLDDEELRQCFEDYVFPEFVEQGGKRYMLPVRDIARGGSIPKTATMARQMARYSMTQYLYALLNPVKMLVQSFGEYPGMSIARTQYLVCVEVGDPATKRLDKAFIQYAIPLNRTLRDCVVPATAEQYIDLNAGYQHYYALQGDAELEKEIFDRWFNSDDYYFNAVVYPKVRAFSEF